MMPPKGGSTITDDQVKAVAAYVYSLSHKKLLTRGSGRSDIRRAHEGAPFSLPSSHDPNRLAAADLRLPPVRRAPADPLVSLER